MSNPDSVLSLSLRLGATLCANGLTVAAKIADPLLNRLGQMDKRAMRRLTMDGSELDRCKVVEDKLAASEKLIADLVKAEASEETICIGCMERNVADDHDCPSIAAFYADGGPTEWMGGTFPSGQPTDFDGPVGEYPEVELIRLTEELGLYEASPAKRPDVARQRSPGAVEEGPSAAAPQQSADHQLANPQEQPVSVGVAGPGADGSVAQETRRRAEAIREVLAAHEAYDYAGKVECPHRFGSEVCDDWKSWREHVAPLILEALPLVPPATSADQTTSALMAALITQVRIFRAVIKGDDDHYRYLDELIADADKRAEQHADIGD